MKSVRLVLHATGSFVLMVALAGVARPAASSPGDKAKPDKPAAAKVDKKGVLRLRAFAVDLNRAARAASGTFDIVIERWSTEDEAERLKDVLIEEGGGDQLLAAVQKIKPRVGWVTSPRGTAWDLQFARETALPDGGRRIIIGSDRPRSYWEATNPSPVSEYEFMLAEMRLDKNGKGEGRLAPAAMVSYDEDTKTIEVENYESQPVRLSQVEVIK